MVLPLMWFVYSTTVQEQKKYYKTIVNEGPQYLPFQARTPSLPLGPNLHLQAVLLLKQYRDFQVQILKGTKEVFFLNFNFNERRAVIGHKEQQVTEEVVLAGDRFPAITLNKSFRIIVQIMDDCIISSIWLTDLKLFESQRFPEKHIWCSRDYSIPYHYSFKIHSINDHLMQSPGEDDQHYQDHLGQQELEQYYGQQEQEQHYGQQEQEHHGQQEQEQYYGQQEQEHYGQQQQEHNGQQEQEQYNGQQEQEHYHSSEEENDSQDSHEEDQEQEQHYGQQEQEHYHSLEEENDSQDSHEEDQEEDIKLVSVVVYSGVILQ